VLIIPCTSPRAPSIASTAFNRRGGVLRRGVGILDTRPPSSIPMGSDYRGIITSIIPIGVSPYTSTSPLCFLCLNRGPLSPLLLLPCQQELVIKFTDCHSSCCVSLVFSSICLIKLIGNWFLQMPKRDVGTI
jgi:hypothetical protein